MNSEFVKKTDPLEKALKALLVSIDVSFPHTHSISHIIELIEEHSIIVPDEIKDSISLTEINPKFIL